MICDTEPGKTTSSYLKKPVAPGGDQSNEHQHKSEFLHLNNTLN